MRFNDRDDAARRLSNALLKYKGKDAILLAIPRGGVVLGRVIADTLGLPLDVIVTKKITPPDNEEYAIGAVDGTNVILDEDAMEGAGVSRAALKGQIQEKQRAVMARYKKFRGSAAPPDVNGKIAIIVDDGIATGNTMKAAIALARTAGAKKVVAAFPVGPTEGVVEMRSLADEVVCLSSEPAFMAVGEFYDEFPQVE
ncbi:MAG: phosphoribosyltransferase family protein, partial [Nanoarchaeota archaeon]